MDRVIFLDIDGVLNSETSVQRGELLDSETIRRLNRIFRETRCKFVLSSSWRVLHGLARTQKMLRAAGFEGELVGETPDFVDSCRGGEIGIWLAEHPNCSFVILDDDDDMGNLAPRLVQTNPKMGLSDADVEAVLELFSRPHDSRILLGNEDPGFDDSVLDEISPIRDESLWPEIREPQFQVVISEGAREIIQTAFKPAQDWIRIREGAWVIFTDEEPSVWMDRLREAIPNHVILVARIEEEFAECWKRPGFSSWMERAQFHFREKATMEWAEDMERLKGP